MSLGGVLLHQAPTKQPTQQIQRKEQEQPIDNSEKEVIERQIKKA